MKLPSLSGALPVSCRSYTDTGDAHHIVICEKERDLTFIDLACSDRKAIVGQPLKAAVIGRNYSHVRHAFTAQPAP